MKATYAILASMLLLTSACIPRALGQGDLLPPPGPPGPTMRTLQELWDKIDGLEVRATALETQNTILQSHATLLQRQLGLLTASTVNFAWVTSRIAIGSSSSLAFGPDGQPAVAFRTNAGIQFARYDGTAWIVTTVPGPVGWQPSLAFGPDGQPAIAYSGPGAKLQFASFDGSAWSVTELDHEELAGEFPSLSFGSNGLPGIAYRKTNKVGYAGFNGTDWVLSVAVAANNIHGTVSSAIGPDGAPVIVYHIYAGDTGTVKIARLNGSLWATSTVATDSYLAIPPLLSVRFGPDGQPAVAYADRGTQRLHVARFNGSAWTSSLVTVGTECNYLSLGFGLDGQPVLAYQNDSGDLIFSRYVGNLEAPAWTATVVDTAEYVGYDCSVAFGPDGQPAIAYWESGVANSWVKIARKGVFQTGP